MKSNALLTICGVILIILALSNLGGGVGQWIKAEAAGGMASLSETTANFETTRQILGQGAVARGLKDAEELRNMRLGLFGVAVLIFGGAVVQFAAAVGIFARKEWALNLGLVAVILGLIIEAQDIYEDGFGLGQILFVLANAVVFWGVVSGRGKGAQHQTIASSVNRFHFVGSLPGAKATLSGCQGYEKPGQITSTTSSSAAPRDMARDCN